MRIDGFSSHSYPIKRTPRKPVVLDESVEDVELTQEQIFQSARGARRNGGLPAQAYDLPHPRPRDRKTATALASYLATAGFSDWETEVLGLDLYI
ncbi:hypothetical protein [Pseudomonas fulva]|nr:hypothetical protein [Pseudomonas fulva]MBF8779815.1 hypothetical protein [Pseudomonas fulva]